MDTSVGTARWPQSRAGALNGAMTETEANSGAAHSGPGSAYHNVEAAEPPPRPEAAPASCDSVSVSAAELTAPRWIPHHSLVSTTRPSRRQRESSAPSTGTTSDLTVTMSRLICLLLLSGDGVHPWRSGSLHLSLSYAVTGEPIAAPTLRMTSRITFLSPGRSRHS